MSTMRNRRAERKRKQRTASILVWGSLGTAALLGVALLIWRSLQTPAWETVPIPPEYVTHVEAGTPPGPYPSDPPAGGVHYASELEAGFYDEDDLATLPEHPEGALVHNLEHGYVIFWYNCDLLEESACLDLKTSIQKVMDDFDGVKLIAFPWKSLETPVAMTSWGKLMRFDTFDPTLASAFIKANRNKAPEPNAP